MRRAAAVVLLLLGLALAGLGAVPAPVAAAPDAPRWAVRMLDRVNEVRSKAGAPPLRLCAPLMDASQKYAKLMARRNHFDHTGPNGSQPWDRGEAEGYRYTAYAENIAAGQRSVAAAMRAWVDSPGHYANLINTRMTHAGFGHARSTASRYSDYWVQNFGAGGRC